MPSVATTEAITWPSLAIITATFTVLIGFIKLMFDLHFEKNKFRHKNLEIAQSSLSANLHKPSLKQRYLTEQVFSLIYRCSLTYDEINVLLKYSNPSRAFELFVKGKEYLKLSNKLNSINLKNNYIKKSVGSISVFPREIIFLISYMIFGFLGSLSFAIGVYVIEKDIWFSVLKIFEWSEVLGVTWFVLGIFFGFVFWIFAAKSIGRIGNVRAAFTLVEMSEKSLK